MQQAFTGSREVTVWLVAASRATGSPSTFARPACPVPGDAVPQIVSICPLQTVRFNGQIPYEISHAWAAYQTLTTAS